MAYESELYISRFEKEEIKDINEEFSLPDYLPEIKRILLCRESVTHPSVYCESGGLNVDGKVKYSVIYVGNDAKLYSAPFEGNYSFSFASACEDDSSVNIASVCAEGVSAKALSPRRVVIKGKMKACLVSQSPAGDEECITESSVPASCEALCEGIEYAVLEPFECEVFELADEVINNASSESQRIIYCESNPLVADTDVSNGEVCVRGEVDTDIMICDDSLSEVPRMLRRKTPFAFTLSAKSSTERSPVCANVSCVACEARIEDSGILINITCSVELLSASVAQSRICSDIYSPKNKITPKENSFATYLPLICCNKNMSVNSALAAAEAGLDRMQKVLFSFADAVCEKITVGEENGRENVVGKVVFKMITVNDSEEINEYDCKEVSIPFKYDISRELGDRKITSSPFLLANATATRTSSRFDGERVGLDTELSLSFTALEKHDNRGIASILVDEKISTSGEYIRILYPCKGESLWSVAKRTNSSLDTIAARNDIAPDVEKSSPSSLSNVKYLIL